MTEEMMTSLECLTAVHSGSMQRELNLHQCNSTGDKGKLGARRVIYNCLPDWNTDIFHSKSLIQQGCHAPFSVTLKPLVNYSVCI